MSPRDYFLFSPLLPQVAMGSLPFSSIIEPIKNWIKKIDYIEGEATKIYPDKNKIEYLTKWGENIEIDYDQLVIAIGSTNEGLDTISGAKQYAIGLQDLQDCVLIRNKLIDCLQKADRSNNDEERQRQLQFVVVGAGPVAHTTAAYLHDSLDKYTAKFYPQLKGLFKVTNIHTSFNFKNVYDKNITIELSKFYFREKLNQVKAQVLKLTDNFIECKLDSGLSIINIPYNLCIWTNGQAIHPLVESLRHQLKDQHNHSSLVCDMGMQVQGSHNIFALGDCSTIDQRSLINKWSLIFNNADINHDGSIDLDEYKILMDSLSKFYPSVLLFKERLFELVDTDHNQILTTSEFKSLMVIVDKLLTRFPSTAEVASQQGRFLAYHLNNNHYNLSKDQNVYKGPIFKYKHFGGYEYVGSEDGLVDRGSQGNSIVQGFGALWMWNVIFFSRDVSKRMRFNILLNWIYSKIFSNHPTRI